MSGACTEPSRKYPGGRTGTSAGYQRHRAVGEEPCPECFDANREKGRLAWASLTPDQREARREQNRIEAARRRAVKPAGVRCEKHSYIAKNRAIIRAAKDKPCMDCGVAYPYYVMQFDHVVGDKKFNIGPIGPTSKRSTLLEEIAKCQVVCANCHAMRTHARKELKKSA